jgi:hypothetical protein
MSMKRVVAELRTLPSPMRYASVGVVVAGVAGAIGGLVIGLHVHAATAWFAMFEVGLPAAIAGGTVGFLAGCTIELANRCKRHRAA